MAEGRTLREGAKDDGVKNRLDLLPFDALEEVGNVYTIGARKYADRNWELGISYMRIVGALLRHLFAWLRGVEFDAENGQRHITAVAWNAIALTTYEIRGMNGSRFDDRPLRKEVSNGNKVEEGRLSEANGICDQASRGSGQ